MKINKLTQIIENKISSEVRRIILEETGNKEYYHVTVDNEPIETFETIEKAEQYVMDNKEKYKGKELLIDKKTYASYDEMIDSLDEMGEKLEQTENIDMKKKLKENYMESEVYEDDMSPHEKFMMNKDDEESGEIEMSEDFDERVISKYLGPEDKSSETDDMDSEITEHMPFSAKKQFTRDLKKDADYREMVKKGQDSMFQYGPVPDATENDIYTTSYYKYNDVEDDYDDELYEGDTTGMCSECGSMLNEEGMCSECGGAMTEEKGMCSECGSMLNEEGMCSECGGSKMYESKKKTLILKESELVDLIKKMVSESIPGAISAKNSREGSGKENKKYYDEVGKKMKDYLTFEGNDNPEFPHQIGKGEKVARHNTPEEDDIVAKNFAGLQNLEYDVEPSDKFKERLKMAIEGDSKMGNGVLDKTSKKELSNTAKVGEEPEQKNGNQIKTDTAKKMQKQMKNREEDKKKRKIYKKENVPVSTADAKDDGINENKVPKTVLEEMQKMKRLTNYDKRTQ